MNRQAIIRIKDKKSKTISKCYFHSIEQYSSQIMSFVSNVQENQEIYIKIGNLYGEVISYDDIITDMSIDKCSFEEELFNKFLGKYTAITYYLRVYLSK